jgi:hypothetical protein
LFWFFFLVLFFGSFFGSFWFFWSFGFLVLFFYTSRFFMSLLKDMMRILDNEDHNTTEMVLFRFRHRLCPTFYCFLFLVSDLSLYFRFVLCSFMFFFLSLISCWFVFVVL